MREFLLDTNVISELTKDAPARRVIEFLSTDQYEFWISSVVIHELEYGLELLPQGRRRSDLQDLLWGFVAEHRGRIVPLDQTGAEWAARFRARAHRTGRVLELGDALIAGTAKSRTLAVATRNVVDFSELELEVVNPWESV